MESSASSVHRGCFGFGFGLDFRRLNPHPILCQEVIEKFLVRFQPSCVEQFAFYLLANFIQGRQPAFRASGDEYHVRAVA